MKITKIGFIKISLLTTTMFLNTGCLFGLFEDEPKAKIIQKSIPVQETRSIQEPTFTQTSTSLQKYPTSVERPTTTSIQTLSPSISIPTECTDEPNALNGCQKAPIAPKELKVKKVVTPTGGEIHRLRSIQGKNITIVERPTGYLFPQFKNKIVVLEMFGKNCSHCIKEMPVMNKLRRKYRRNLEIVALQVEGRMSKHQANRLLRRHKIHYPIIAGQTATNLQYQIQTTYGWTGILPFIMVIKDGVTEFTYRGEVNYNRINKDIRSLLR